MERKVEKELNEKKRKPRIPKNYGHWSSPHSVGITTIFS
jgi:hypothetical protein